MRLQNLKFYLAHKIIRYVVSPEIKRVHLSVSHLSKKRCLSSLRWAAVSKQIQQYALTHRADVCFVSFTVTLVYRNTQVTTVMIYCIQFWQGIWVLGWGKWADLGAPYKTGKIYEHRTLLKLKYLCSCTLSWLQQVKYGNQWLQDC